MFFIATLSVIGKHWMSSMPIHREMVEQIIIQPHNGELWTYKEKWGRSLWTYTDLYEI